MDTMVLGECEIRYRVLGNGPLVALTPGGRLPGDAVAATAELLAEDHTVLLWDRRNTGSSHVWFGQEPEHQVWADDLAELVRRLGTGPAWLAGASAGARVSYLTALRHRDVAKGLLLWSVSGGPYASQVLGYQYHTPFINEALRAGMQGVAQTQFFAERIAANPDNRERLLTTPTDHFVASMRAWNQAFFYKPDTPVIGATEGEIRTLRLPTLVFDGDDDIHPAAASRRFVELVTGALLRPGGWTRDEWMNLYVGKVIGDIADLYVRLVPAMREFISMREGG